MNKMFWKWLPISPLTLLFFIAPIPEAIGASVLREGVQEQNAELLSSDTSEHPVIDHVEKTDTSEAQVNSVSQLSDVSPTDWAFQALQFLVERYGCIVGYPNKTYGGNRSLTRYEFAAGVNACLDRVTQLISTTTSDLVKKEDLVTLRKLQEQFAPELATLRGRVDILETQTAIVEQQRFSTTTKLNGEAVFVLSGFVTGQDSNGRNIPKVTSFADRIRLNFDSSFSGKDLLRVRLQALNLNYFSSRGGTGTRLPEGTLAVNADLDDGAPANNEVTVDALYYQFPLGKKTLVTLFANQGEVEDFVNTINPFLDGGASGDDALSKFGSRNSVYYFIPQGTGFGIAHKFSDKIEFSLGYMATTASSPTNGQGLFNGSYGAIAQLTLQPSESILIGLTYVNAYDNLNDGLTIPGTGSIKANLGFATNSPVSSNAYGLEASFQVNPRLYINAWGGYIATRVLGVGDASIWNYAVGLAFPDFGKKGNSAGLIVGMEPKVTGADAAIASVFTTAIEPQNRNSPTDRDTSIHVEGFYSYVVSDNITITPGFIWLTAPNHDARNSDAVLGVIRTTFTF